MLAELHAAMGVRTVALSARLGGRNNVAAAVPRQNQIALQGDLAMMPA